VFAYDPPSSAAYAETWWNSRNTPMYFDYSPNDCANFVSQCLIAGGLSLSAGTNGAGANVDGYGCIPSCDNLHMNLTIYQNCTYSGHLINDYPSYFTQGDVAMFGCNSNNPNDYWQHATINVISGTPALNAHTTDRYHKPVSFYYPDIIPPLTGFQTGDFYHINSSSSVMCNNDNTCNPYPLTLHSTCVNSSCSTVGATTQAIPFSGGGSCTSVYQSGRYDDDVWFSVTSSSTNPVTINVNPTSNTSNFDVVIGIYSGNCSSPVQINCADLYGVGIAEQLVFTPTSGTTYFIRVFSYGIGSTYSGNFNICATQTPSVLPNLTKYAEGFSTGANSVSINVTVQNTGTVTAAASRLGYYLGSNPGTIDYLIGTDNIPSLSPGQTSAQNISVNLCGLGIPNGYYYVTYYIDDLFSVSETNESDNGWYWNSPTMTINCCSTPTQPSAILGPTLPCKNSSGNSYSVENVSGTTYTWSYSGSGAIINSGIGTNILSVSYSTGATSGTWTVIPSNACGSGPQQTLSVTPQECSGGPYTITVVSQNPSSGVNINVTPLDNNGNANGSTLFTRIYNLGTSVNLTAPAVANGNSFVKWLKNGTDYSTNLAITFTVSDINSYTAVYQTTTTCSLTIIPSNQTVSFNAGYTTFSVFSNCSWTAYSNSYWCTITPSGSGNGIINATFLQNPLGYQREAYITIVAPGIPPLYVTVTQEGAPCSFSAPVINSNSPLCEGTTLTLSASAPANSLYFWSGPNGFSSNNPTIYIPSVTTLSSGTYYCYFTNSGCQSPQASTIVSIYPAPNASFTYNDVGNTVTFSNTSINANSYSWTFGDGSSPSTVTNPVYTYAAAGNYNVCLTANNTGCNSSSNCQLVSIGSSGPSATSPVFAKLFNDGNPDHRNWMCYDLVQSIVDSGYICLGQYQNPITYNNTVQYFKLDKNGNILWVRELPANGSAGPSQIIRSQNGYLVVFYYDGLSSIMEIDESGNKLWAKKLNESITKFIKTDSDGYVGIGGGLKLIKIDNSGNILWQKKYEYSLYGSTSINITSQIAQDASGNLYLGGTIGNASAIPPIFSYDALLIKTDASGNHQWSKYYYTVTNVLDQITGLVIDNNSELVFSGFSRNYSTSTVNGFVGKMNTSGTVLSSKQSNDGFSLHLFSTSPNVYNCLAPFSPSNTYSIITFNNILGISQQKQFNLKSVLTKKSTLDNKFIVSGQYPFNTSATDYRYNVFKVSYNDSSCVDTVSTGMTMNDLSFPLNTLSVTTNTPSISASTLSVNPIVSVLFDTSICHQCNLTATVSTNGSTTFCSGGSATLSANPGMSSYLWSNGQTTQSIIVTNSGEFSVAIIDSYGCIASSQAETITVYPLPFADAGPDKSICAGSSTQIGSNPVSGYTYNWLPTSGLSNPAVSNPIANPSSNVTYTLHVTNSFGCSSTDDIVVTVKTLPSAYISGSATICTGTSTTLSVALAGIPPWDFTISNGITPVSFSGVTSNPKAFIVSPLNTEAYIITNVLDASGCSNIGNGSAVVTVNPLPSGAGIITGPSTVTAGQSGVAYSIPVITNVTGYSWTLPYGASIISGNNTNSIIVFFSSNATSGIINVTGTNSCGSGSFSPDFNVTVTPSIPATQNLTNMIVGNGQVNCYNATQSITVAGNGTLFFVLNGGSATLIAGQKISFLPSTTVQLGGYLWGYIAPNGPFCNTPSLPSVMISEDEIPSTIGQSSFRIYPNPTTGTFMVEFNEGFSDGIVTIDILGMRGEKVYTETILGEKNFEFSLADRPPGIYVIHIIMRDKTETAKIIKL